MERGNKFSFGKVDWNGRGRKVNLITVEITLKMEEGKNTFSASGDIWNASRTDCICGGQCLDEIAKYTRSPLFKKIYRLWKLYHLNDMHPECEHQEELGWKDKASEKVNIYTFTTTMEVYSARRKIEDKVLKAAQAGEQITLNQEEQFILGAPYEIKTHTPELAPEIAKYYKLKNTEVKTLGWLTEKEHPEGILSKGCPVCGYKYGHGWQYREIPADDLKQIKELIGISDEAGA